jgi:hypothetical protein
MFRELRYGVLFYLSAMAGAVLGHSTVSFPRVRSGDADAEAREAAIMAVIGAFAGAVAWLAFKYRRERRRSGEMRK